jgi:hypothetical protein
VHADIIVFVKSNQLYRLKTTNLFMKEQITGFFDQNPMVNRVCKAMLVLCILLVATVGFASRAHAQDTIHVAAIQKDADKNTWHTLKAVNDVTVSYQYVDCGSVEFVQFKINNSSASKVAVSWKYKLHRDGAVKEMSQDDANVKYTVEASSALTGACYSQYTRLGVFVRESGNSLVVTDIELIDLNISITQ